MDKKNILIVDDEEIIRFNINRILSDKSYRVTMAESGEEAINYLRNREFELVLTDLVMEGVDGIAILEEVKRIAPHTVVIIITGYGSLGSAIKAMRKGAYDYITKPCEPEELVMRINRGIDKYNLEKRLLEANRLEAILSNIGIYTLSPQGNITYDNMALSSKLWGKNNLTGTCIFDLEPLGKLGLEECFSKAFQGVSSVRENIAYLPENHDEQSILSSHIVPGLYPNGKVMSVSWILEDNTKRINVMHQIGKAEKLAAIGKLAAGIAHEINNPLNTINLDLEFFKKKILPDDPLMENVLSISKQIVRIAGIVNQLQDHAREKESHLPEVSDLRKVLDNPIFSILFRQTAENNKPVTVLLDDSLPEILISPNKLSQVLMNLIKNAAEAIESQGKILVSARPVLHMQQDIPAEMNVESNRTFMQIKIRDTGKGIKEEDLSELFEPFFTTKGFQGTGLGLFISYCIIKSYDGWITIKSRVGEGTEFAVNLPTVENSIGRVP